MSDLTPITREETLLDGQDLTPITRKEMFIKRIYDKTQEIPDPITREEWFLKKAGEGTSPVAIEQLNVTENGTYSEEGKAYSPVIVDVPLPSNAHLATPITSQPIANASTYPLPKCDVTVSNADKCEVIVTNDGQIIEDNVPYLNRHSAGGNTELDEVIGGTVAWNQLFPFDSDSYTLPIGLSVSITNGRMVANGTATTSTTSTIVPSRISNAIKPIDTHKYILHIDGTQNFNSFRFSIYGTTTQDISLSTTTSKVFNCTVSNATEAEFIAAVTEGNSYSCDFTTYLIDLTQLFGSTIADYIYSLEQATAGSGIAWLKSYGFLTEDYYPYNAGELMSVKTSGHVMRDGSNNIIGNYPLSPIELRGIPKLDANNKLYYDGDSYRCDGRVKRRYGIVDLGTLSWSKQNHATLGTYFYGNVAPLGIKATGDYYLNVANAICSNYIATRRFPEVFTNKTFCYDGTDTSVTQIQIKDDNYSDAATFKTAMSGVYLVYEHATPTKEYTYSFEENQTVDANGTEEYIDDRTVAIPVGHSTKYYHGKAYTKYFAEKSGVVSMADEGIMPTNPMYINANGSIDAEYWA